MKIKAVKPYGLNIENFEGERNIEEFNRNIKTWQRVKVNIDIDVFLFYLQII